MSKRDKHTIESEIVVLEDEIKGLDEENWPRTATLYTHSSKDVVCDSLRESGIDLPLEDKFWYKAVFALYEVEFTISVNRDGTYEILEVKDGKDVLKKCECC